MDNPEPGKEGGALNGWWRLTVMGVIAAVAGGGGTFIVRSQTVDEDIRMNRDLVNALTTRIAVIETRLESLPPAEMLLRITNNEIDIKEIKAILRQQPQEQQQQQPYVLPLVRPRK